MPQLIKTCRTVHTFCCKDSVVLTTLPNLPILPVSFTKYQVQDKVELKAFLSQKVKN